MNSRRIGASSLARQLGEWRIGKREAGYRQLGDALRLLILDGRVPLGARLPGERELATALGVSRTTVTAAYALLRDRDYLASRQGSGSVTRVPSAPGSRPEAEAGRFTNDIIDFSVATLPAAGSVHGSYRQALDMLPADLAGPGYQPRGLDDLRQVIAERYSRRGCPTRLEQIMVTNGAVHGFALVMKLLAAPGDRVVIDHPTYPHAIDAIQRAACRPVPVSLYGGGWDVDALDAAIRQTAPRLAFLIPDFHNPTGLCMDGATRSRIAALAARTRTTVVVDETLADLWLDEPPPPSLAAYDEGEQVIALGSTSKTHWGGLRIGWVRASEPLIEALAKIRPTIDLGTPVLEQRAAALLLDADDELEARRALVRGQRRTLLETLARYFPDWRIKAPPGGLSLWIELPDIAGAQLAAAAEAHQVRIALGPRFGVDGAFARFVRLTFTLPATDMERGVARLYQAYQAARITNAHPVRSRRPLSVGEIY